MKREKNQCAVETDNYPSLPSPTWNKMIALFGVFLFCFSACTTKINSTEELMKEISSRYNGKWFTQLSFSQTVYRYENDTLVSTEINDEAYSFPTNLTIYRTQGDTSNRYVYKNDFEFIYENNELISERKITHDAIIIGWDFYNMTFPEIMKRWEDMSYDITKFHEIVDNGRKIYVIGADKGDSLSPQVWFDAEHLYCIKVQRNIPERGLRETLSLNQLSLGDKGWIEQEVVFKANGKVTTIEKYFNIQVIK